MEPEMDIVEAPDDYDPYIKDYPYTGWNNVMGGGGENQAQDIFVPPQVNLYGAAMTRPYNPYTNYGVGVQSLPVIGKYLAIPTLAVIVGLVLGYVLRPKIEPHLHKFEADMFESG